MTIERQNVTMLPYHKEALLFYPGSLAVQRAGWMAARVHSGDGTINSNNSRVSTTITITTMAGALALGDVHTLCVLSLTATLGASHYSHLHFTDEGTEARKAASLAKTHTESDRKAVWEDTEWPLHCIKGHGLDVSSSTPFP